jgi:PiT family inorganic phosphate transporter
MGFAHGSNDAQKTMGIIALTLVAAQARARSPPAGMAVVPASLAGAIDRQRHRHLDQGRLRAGDGGRYRRRRLAHHQDAGHKLVKLHPIHGFAAETSAASVILLASSLGIPVSTTHNISAAIMGVGTAKRFNSIKWTVVEKMIWAWILTIPAAGAFAYGFFRLFQAFGWV